MIVRGGLICGLAAILLGLLMIDAAWAQQIQGWVTDQETGEPIADARVIFGKHGDGGQAYTLRTESDGFYQIMDAAAETGGCVGDSVVIHVLARGYAPIHDTAPCSAGTLNRQYALHRIDRLTRREFVIQYRELDQVLQEVSPLCTRPIVVSSARNSITVQETPEIVESIAAHIRHQDVPPRQIWVEVLLVLATGEGEDAPTYPPELAEVVGKLGKLFRFTEYTIVGRANSMALEGADVHIASTADETERFQFEAGCRIGFAEEMIRLPDFFVSISKPIARFVRANVNLGDGDMAILGASHGDPKEGALITVVTAQVMD